MDDCERRAVLRRSAPGAAPRDEAAAGHGTHRRSPRPSSSSTCSNPDGDRPDAARRPHPRHAQARRTARSTAAWRTSRTSIPSSPSSIATCKAQNIPAGATLKEFSPGQFEVNLHHVASAELACDHGGAAEARGQGGRAQARHGRELHGEALRRVGRLQPARARQPGGCSRPQRLCRHQQGRPVRGHAAPRDRRTRATMAESMAIFAPTANSYRRYRPGHVRAARAELGPQSPRRRAAHPDVRRRGHARRAPPGRLGRQSLSRDGRDPRGHPPRHHEPARAGPDDRPRQRSSRKRSSCRCAGRRRSTRSTPGRSCRSTSARVTTALYGDLPARGRATASTPRSRDRDYEWYLRAI